MSKLKCISCGKLRTKSMFYKNSGCVSGREGECKICWRNRSMTRYGKIKTEPAFIKTMRDNSLMAKYGINTEQFEAIASSQNNVCSICGRKEVARHKGGRLQRLSVDHCHDSGIVRGLLCRKCNTAIAAFDDDIDVLASAISYLRNSKVRKVS